MGFRRRVKKFKDKNDGKDSNHEVPKVPRSFR